jgi:hypothetical protein
LVVDNDPNASNEKSTPGNKKLSAGTNIADTAVAEGESKEPKTTVEPEEPVESDADV